VLQLSTDCTVKCYIWVQCVQSGFTSEYSVSSQVLHLSTVFGYTILRFGTLKSDSTHHFFRNACTKSGSLRFSQFSGCWLILSSEYNIWVQCIQSGVTSEYNVSSQVLQLSTTSEYSVFSQVLHLSTTYPVRCYIWIQHLSTVCKIHSLKSSLNSHNACTSTQM
jgi:hypothetical protein